MLERLGEALEHERAFVADASHELRTPLAILRTELELALAEGRSPEELRAALASAAEETDRLTQLSEDLLTIAQTERGELPLRLARVELAEILDGRRRRFARRAEEAGREIEVERDRGARARRRPPAPRSGDRQHGRQRPALRRRARSSSASRRDGTRSRSTSATAARASREEFLGRAFERFSRASSSSRDGGSGLGLAIVQTVARAHGGEAHAANREGGGADVWLALPLRDG